MQIKSGTCRALACAVALAAIALPARAYWTPLQINLVGNAGLPPAADSVYGIRANALYGSCDTTAFLDVGVFNRTLVDTYGIRAGAFNFCEGEAYGLTVGAVNVDELNKGFTVGAFNYAYKGCGLQIGVINIADDFTGLQIGVLNFHFNSVIPCFPLFNMGSGEKK